MEAVCAFSRAVDWNKRFFGEDFGCSIKSLDSTVNTMDVEDQAQCLTEKDIEGASLNGRQPNQLTNKELKFWLACRGKQHSKLKTKAELVARVHNVIESGQHLNVVDPSKDGLYLRRKQQLQLQNTNAKPSSSEDIGVLAPPTSGWTKSLEHLPEFTDLNIQAYTRQSGKKVKRTETGQPQTCMKTCVRPEERGYQFFSDKYIHDYWLAVAESNVTYIKAKCFASTKKNDKPHQLWAALSPVLPHDILTAYCTCTAGKSGFCNHVLALLYQTRHFHMSGTKTVPDDVSKTSVAQVWDKPRVLGISPEPVMQITVKKAKVDGNGNRPIQSTLYEARAPHLIPNDAERLKKVQDEMRAENPLYGISYMAAPDPPNANYIKTSLGCYTPVGSVLSYQLSPTEGDFDVNYDYVSVDSLACSRSCNTSDLSYPPFPLDQVGSTVLVDTLPAEQQKHMKAVCVDIGECRKIEEETRDQADSEKWWHNRRYRLTSSNFKEIVHHKQASVSKLVQRLTSKPIAIKVPALEHGKKYEGVAAGRYCDYMRSAGHKVVVLQAGLVVRPECPYLGCSPDYKVIDPETHPHFGLAEIKCPYKHRQVSPEQAAESDPNFCCTVQNGRMKLRENHQYYYQVQGQMGLCGAKWCDFIVYTFKGMHIERIQFNQAFWMEVQENIERFYFTKFLPELLN